MAVQYTARVKVTPSTWLGRVVMALLAAALLALGFFFLLAALIGFCLLMIVVLLRALYPSRTRSATPSSTVVEGEYRVETPDLQTPNSEKRRLTGIDRTQG